MDYSRRRLGRLALSGWAMVVAGCASKPPLGLTAQGHACYEFGKSLRRRKICTPEPVPPAEVEAAAKRFESAPDRLTVYIVRQRWLDAVNRVALSLDGGAEVVTVPRSLVRMRMKPGTHRLAATWRDGSTIFEFDGAAGQLLFIELEGEVWAWGSKYRFEVGEPASSRERAAALRLIGDLG